MNKFRFDDAYKKVYEYDDDNKCYLFYGTYYACGITADMSNTEKNNIVLSNYNES